MLEPVFNLIRIEVRAQCRTIACSDWVVHYPGTEYFAGLITSTFFQSIIGDKQLGDNQSSVTVPLLELIEE